MKLRNITMILLTLSGLLFAGAWLFGCSSAPPVVPITLEEQLKQDNAIGRQLAKDFENQISLVKDIDLEVYLRKIAQGLTEATPALKEAPIGILVIRDVNKKWQNFALPGNRVYLSIGMLKKAEFENEIAAAIAFELAHVLKRHAVLKLEKSAEDRTSEAEVARTKLPENPDEQPVLNVRYFGPAGIFNFSNIATISSIDETVGVLYRAGWDARGLIGIFEKFRNTPDQSPYSNELLLKLIDEARFSISQYPPLRNPFVKSTAFIGMKQRINSL